MTSNYIINFRRRFGWSQKKLANESGVSVNTIKSWETGRTVPPRWIELVFGSILYQIPPYKQYNNSDSENN